MHDTDLTPIEGRLAAATPGPWRWNGDVLHAPAPHFVVIKPYQDDFDDMNINVSQQDADLIAHAPTDLRMLLDELQRTREERDNWKYEAKCEHDHAVGFMDERDNLRNELCLKCGKYREAHNGACDGCRWRK